MHRLSTIYLIFKIKKSEEKNKKSREIVYSKVNPSVPGFARTYSKPNHMIGDAADLV